MSKFWLVLFLLSSQAYAEMTVETDFGRRHGTGYLGLGKNPVYTDEVFSTVDLPLEFDWRDYDAVSSIKNQGSCGSCWAMAITKSLESARMVLGYPELNLSEQHQVSCNKKAYGCSGGFMNSAFFVVDPGITDEQNFPYTGRNSACKSNLPIKAKAVKYELLGTSSRSPAVDEIKAAILKYGPVFVTVAAGGSGWGSSGTEVTGCRNSRTNHMVNLVGWTKDKKWIMANSWGTSWKNKGYALMKFGCDKIAEEAGFILAE
jgi:C1A family cysteine protease